MNNHQPNTLHNGRYSLVRPIKEGGMGTVYEGYDNSLKRKVALKAASISEQVEFLALKEEASRLAQLRHATLVTVIDLFEEQDALYLVQVYIEGEDLADRLKRQGHPFAVNNVLAWADALLDVLDYLHTLKPPVIHRDIKPANLKLTPDGKIVLLDFGIAKGGLPSAYLRNNTAPNIRGSATPAYAPPEQLVGSSTDARSDLYALGATLYQLLTNKQPKSAIERQANKVDALRPANEINSQVFPALAELLSKAMALEPNERFSSAKEMQAALKTMDFATNNPIVIPPATSWPSDAATVPKRSKPNPPSFKGKRLSKSHLSVWLLILFVSSVLLLSLVINHEALFSMIIPPIEVSPSIDISTPVSEPDLVLGVTNERVNCPLITQIGEELFTMTPIRDKASGQQRDLKVDSRSYDTFDALREALVSGEINLTFCYLESDQFEDGYIRQIGDSIWQNQQGRWLVMANAGFHNLLENEMSCPYELMVQIDFGNSSLDEGQISLDKQHKLVQSWRSCQPR